MAFMQVAASAPVGAALALTSAIQRLAAEASVEINVADSKHLQASRQWLRPGTRVFVSYLPNQTWEQSRQASLAACAAGFEPVPHIPARLVPSQAHLERILGELAGVGVQEVLLIAGDYPEATGPYSDVSEVLKTGLLGKHGFRRVSLAGHPEGHSKVALPVIRQAERDKVSLAQSLGLETSLVTQFFFEAQPFIDWAASLRQQGVSARVVGGLAGPASVAALFRFAMRCGVGPSIRALGAKPTSMMKLLGDHGPELVIRDLVEAQADDGLDFNGVHFFCFGGFLRACQWINAVAAGKFALTQNGGFMVTEKCG